MKDGDIAAATKSVKDGFRCYPLAQAGKPPEQKFVNVSGTQFNTIHSNDFSFFEELNAVIQYESANAYDPDPLGRFASIGIKKGQSFAPDERMKRLLTEGVAIGNAAARSISFANRDKNVYYYYPDRQWFASFAGPYDFIEDGALNSDKRVMWFYNATGVTPAMSMPQVGTGSVYPMVARDSNGNYLDGGNTYSVTLAEPIPINNFWAFTVYDGQTWSLLETDQRSSGLDSTNQEVTANDDGSARRPGVASGSRRRSDALSDLESAMPVTHVAAERRPCGPGLPGRFCIRALTTWPRILPRRKPF